MRSWIAVLVLLCCCTGAAAKKNTATVSGRVIDENNNPLERVSVTILGRQTGIFTNDSGLFSIKVPADDAFALVFSSTGYRESQKNFFLNKNEQEEVTVILTRKTTTLATVVTSAEPQHAATGEVRINPRDAISIPSASGGVEALIKTQVGSNNELTSQYNVRGGNFDENLVYINDFEVFRPYLVNSGQQEGLSIINPELTRNISFYNGGFAANYGDKMSSVLDIQYKKPTTQAG